MDASDLVVLSEKLPEVELKEYRHWTSITVRGKGFGWVNHHEDTAMIKSTHLEREAMIATAPETFGAGWESRTTAWVSVRLAEADPEELFEILADAWRMTAPKRAVAEFDEALGL